MSERGETDSRSIGSSDKFRATAVRRNVVNHQTSGYLSRSEFRERRRSTLPCADDSRSLESSAGVDLEQTPVYSRGQNKWSGT
ncbi:hypothetical protein TNCV_989441 [Trichonephila clavipes]|nr:hypothetical protein TNCV_989441 [Trichonephila clavipes]